MAAAQCHGAWPPLLLLPFLQAMGLEVLMVPGKGPVLPQPIRTPSDLNRLVWDPNTDACFAHLYDAINLTRQQSEGSVPLLGFCGGPWTLMAYMIEGGGSKAFTNSKRWLYEVCGFCFPAMLPAARLIRVLVPCSTRRRRIDSLMASPPSWWTSWLAHSWRERKACKCLSPMLASLRLMCFVNSPCVICCALRGR